MKRRRAREHDQDVAREQADRRREELLARLRGGQAAPAEPKAEAAESEQMAEADAQADAEPEEAQLPPAASEAPSLDGSPDEKPEVGDVG